jgi:GTP cyclohydrolase II
MNPAIRCEPTPFPLASGKAAVANAALFPKAADSTESGPAEFREVLDSEIEEQKDEGREAKNPEVCAAYVVVPTVLQLLQEIPLTASAELPAHAERVGLELASTSPLVSDQENAAKDDAAGAPDVSENSDPSNVSLTETLKPAEHKVPPEFETVGEKVAEFAENRAERAKMASGTVGAQEGPMLTASPKTEETAPKQNLLLASEQFEASSFDQPIVIKSAISARDASTKSNKGDIDFSEAPMLEAIAPEWSSFEGLAEASDTQALRPVKGVDVAEAIRTHVQLLKSSGQEKLEVILRPDPNTEIRLHVEKVNGQVLVQARCERGDIARLEANWTVIQQTLANQGVRVESLQHGNHLQNQSQNWNHSSGSSQQETARERGAEQIFVEQKIESPKGNRPQPTRASAAVRGWQSWA